MTVNYQILYWRDIPAQVRVRLDKQRLARSLSDRFQESIDIVAMRAGATSTDDYLQDWRTSEWQPGEGEPEALLEKLITELETTYDPDRLASLRANEGYEAATPA